MMKFKTNTFGVYLVLVSVFLVLFPIQTAAQLKNDKFVVVLDAGHGGHDSGNLGNGYVEKEIALKIVLKVGKMLSENPNIKVVYTRKTDKFVELIERGNIANHAQADLFVSVHCNAHSSSAHGTETFVLGPHRNERNFEIAQKENSVIFLEKDYETNYKGLDPNSPESVMSILLSQEEYLDQSIQLASLIQDKFTKQLKRENRGVKQAGFVVLYQSVMPSVLVEVGFLTYKNEGRYLNSKSGQSEISDAIAIAILEYYKALHRNIVDTQIVKSNTADSNGIIFKVQIAASNRDIAPKPQNFKGLSEISKLKSGTLYKYYHGATSNYATIKENLVAAKQKGYTSSFIVAYKDGIQISITDALKSSTEKD